MGSWSEYFTWLLGVAVAGFGWSVNRIVKRRDKVDEMVERHDRQIAVLISLNERRGGDRRADFMEDYDEPDRRHGERRA